MTENRLVIDMLSLEAGAVRHLRSTNTIFFKRLFIRPKNFAPAAACLFVLSLILSLAVIAQDPGPAPDWPAELRVGFIPYLGPEKTKERYQPLIDHLEKSLGLKVTAVVPQNYVGVIVALTKKQVEFAYTGSTGYLDANRLAGAEAIAMELNPDGSPGYHALLISAKESGIETIEQAGGKVLAFTDPDSTSGYLAPIVYLVSEKNITPGSFASRVVFAGSHKDVFEGVLQGTFHVGATNDMDFTSMCEMRGVSPEKFNILWKSELIPGAPITARNDLPQTLTNAFLKALLEINQDKKALEKMHIGGFIPAKNSDYDSIRKLKYMKTK